MINLPRRSLSRDLAGRIRGRGADGRSTARHAWMFGSGATHSVIFTLNTVYR